MILFYTRPGIEASGDLVETVPVDAKGRDCCGV
jgi:hypothetical protein